MNDNPTFRLRIDPAISSGFPQYSCLVLYASNLRNAEPVPAAVQGLREIEARVREKFAASPPSAHPHIAAWRAAYKTFGAKPKKHLCSIEALAARILQSGSLPDINPIVNAYNRVSLLHLVPLGGEDWDQLRSDLVLRYALGDEPFITQRAGTPVSEQPNRGEVIWVDSEGVTCRRWNWRQCDRTAITPKTTRAYFVFDILAPFGLTHAQAAAQDLITELSAFSPEIITETQVLQAARTPALA